MAKVKNHKKSIKLNMGVPQGFVLGPSFLYQLILYMQHNVLWKNTLGSDIKFDLEKLEA